MDGYENGESSLVDHEKYVELCAVATSGTLSISEQLELDHHLAECSECREVFEQYRVLTSKAMPALAEDYPTAHEAALWDDTQARSRLFSKIVEIRTVSAGHLRPLSRPGLLASALAIAACLLVAVALSAYRAGQHHPAMSAITAVAPSEQVHSLLLNQRSLLLDKRSLEAKLEHNLAALNALQAETARKQAEVEKSEAALRTMETRLFELTASENSKREQVQALASERDSFLQQLLIAEQRYSQIEDELSELREERRRALLRTASLETEVQRLTGQVREQDQTLRDQEQYLASDRDIRELMGARQLYIADVFDVDNAGRTRKPFGRIFYTRDKSLVFYAFDLDQAPKLKNASSFQAWGLKQSPSQKPVNLGIFYLDNEANRRWVLRFDDAAKLAQINAIFVTVEPNGGSSKPTAKPFLYASLRQTPNHP